MIEAISYGVQGFEGQKAYKTEEGKIVMFRPMENFKRFVKTTKTLGLPSWDPEELLKCLMKLCQIEHEWIPQQKGCSLYIRPVIFETSARQNFAPVTKAKLVIGCCPSGPYFPSGFTAVKVLADVQYVRCCYGGTGQHKLGANYTSTMVPGHEKATVKGYAGIAWIWQEQVTEIGAMNLFVHWLNEKGEKEVRTHPNDGLILPGITRMSLIDLCKDMGHNVVEKPYKIRELVDAIASDRVFEMWMSGTAAIIVPIKGIAFNDIEYKVPIDEKTKAGPITIELYNKISGIQLGKIEFKDWCVKLEDYEL